MSGFDPLADILLASAMRERQQAASGQRGAAGFDD
jgi:hypothetical protein